MPTMTRTVDNSQDILDSRNVIARRDELQAERDALQDAIDEAQETLASENPDAKAEYAVAKEALAEWLEDNGDELHALTALYNEGEGFADWAYGATLIRDSYFSTYAMQYADDVGAMSGSESWPMNCIDWDKAASVLQMDFSSIEFDGIDYWIQG